MNASSSAKFGWIIFRATYFSNPAMPFVLARWISAIPPTAICLTSRYGPNCRSAIAVRSRHRTVERVGAILPRGGLRRRSDAQRLGTAWMDEHAHETKGRLRAAIERADNLGRDSVRDVDDVARC